MDHAALTRNFWSQVAREYSAQRPLWVRAARKRVPVAEGAVWRALVRACEMRPRDNPRPLMRLFLDNVETCDPRLLPRRRDRALAGYLSRLRSELKGRRVGLVINNLQLASFELWSQLGDLLSGLYRAGPMPAYGVEAGLFLGNYETTPFGVHQDRVGVIMLMLAGDKRMRIWPPRALSTADVQQGRCARAPLLACAATLSATEGDIVYWPAGFWHVGESLGFSASLNLSLGTHGGTASSPRVALTAEDVVADAVRTLLPRRARWATPPATPPGSALQQAPYAPAALAPALDELRRSLRDGALSLELEAIRLARVTGLGFLAVPAPLARAPKLFGRTTVKKASERPIAWARVGRRMVVAANGHTFRLPFHPAVVDLLRRIDHRRDHKRGQRISVLLRGLPRLATVNRVPTRITARLLRAVLRELILIRALSVC